MKNMAACNGICSSVETVLCRAWKILEFGESTIISNKKNRAKTPQINYGVTN